MRKLFPREVSKLISPGPWNRFGPALPYVYCAGMAKASLLMHETSTAPQFEWIGPTRLGRCPLCPVLATSCEIVVFTGMPVCTVTNPLSDHPESAARTR